MAKLVPVDFDPFEGAAPKEGAGPRLVPVDFDPFAGANPRVPFSLLNSV